MDPIEPPVCPLLIWSLRPPTRLLHLLEFLQLLRAHGIHHDILRFCHQNLSPPKGHQGEEEEDEPGDADEDDHDDMPDVEPLKVEDVGEGSDSRNESDVRECQSPA